MGFDAGKTIEPLDWDFSNIRKGPPGLKDARGTITEPSDQMIGEFLEAQKAIFTEGRKYDAIRELGDDPEPEKVLEVLATLSGKDMVNMMSDIAEIFSLLCSGSPSQEQILLLPMRARVAFYQWLMSEVVRPEAGTPAGSAQVISLPSAQRG